MENIFDFFGGRKNTAMYVAIVMVIAITIINNWIEIDPGYKLRGLIIASQGLYTISNGIKGLINK